MNTKSLQRRKTFAAVYCMHDLDKWLVHSFNSIYDNTNWIFFLVNRRPWNGVPQDLSKTIETLSNLSDPQKKIAVIIDSWKDEATQRNFGLSLVESYELDYCFVVDTDEVYKSEELAEMMRYVEEHPATACWRVQMHTYWKSDLYRIDPPETYRPVVFIRNNSGQFSLGRNFSVNISSTTISDLPFGICHHLSYARTNEEVLRKLQTFSHSHEIVPNWYEKVWLGWDKNPEMTDIHPCWPTAYKKAIPVDSVISTLKQ